MYEKPSSPGSIGKVLDNAFRLFKESFVYCLPASIFVAIANAMPQLANISPELIVERPFVFIVLMLVFYFLIIVSMPALIHRMNGFADGARVPFKTNVGFGLKKSPFVLGAFILYGLVVIVGTLFLIVPGVIFMVSLALFLYAMVVDDFGAMASLERSHRLVWGNWWRTTAIFTVGAALATVLYTMLFAIFGFVAAFMLGESTAAQLNLALSLGFFVIMVLMNLVWAPFFTALGLAVYTDLKLRKRGEDLEARVDELQAT